MLGKSMTNTFINEWNFDGVKCGKFQNQCKDEEYVEYNI